MQISIVRSIYLSSSYRTYVHEICQKFRSKTYLSDERFMRDTKYTYYIYGEIIRIMISQNAGNEKPMTRKIFEQINKMKTVP